MSKTKVIYKDLAVGAEEDASVSTTYPLDGSKPELLPSGVSPGNVITLEPHRWTLGGTFGAFYENNSIAFWSSDLSNENCVLENAPVITISFSKQFSSTGIGFTFDESTGEYCSLLHIEWYQGGSMKSEQDFTPDNTQYFCSKKVESYDKLVITLKKTSLPRRWAKVNRILFGVTRTFEVGELRSASLTNEMDESAIELPASTFTWELDSREDVDYMFQLKQPVEVWNGGRLIGVYYIDGSSRKDQRIYDIDCNDAIGVLSEMQFSGAAYLEGISAKELLETLAAPFSVEYAPGVEDTTLKGVLTDQTRREAIQQVIFAWGVCLATDGGSSLRVFNQPTEPKVIPKNRTFLGTSVETSAIVTKVNVIAHTYTANSDGGFKIGDVAYKDTETVYSVSNPDVTATDRENIKEIANATLISTDIGQVTAQRVYDFYSKRDTNSAQIVYEGEKLGDCVSIYTPWGTLVSGNIRKMQIKLSNTVVFSGEVTG